MIVCTSVSHGNTKRIADVMGEVLGARVVAPDEVEAAELADCDLIGFGSGIFPGPSMRGCGSSPSPFPCSGAGPRSSS